VYGHWLGGSWQVEVRVRCSALSAFTHIGA
jgi:hypothetical protein